MKSLYVVILAVLGLLFAVNYTVNRADKAELKALGDEYQLYKELIEMTDKKIGSHLLGGARSIWVDEARERFLKLAPYLISEATEQITKERSVVYEQISKVGK